MNVSEQTVPKKNTSVAYSHQRYPMELYSSDPGLKPAIRVNNEDEEEKALAEGYTENPPAVPASVAVPQMTTQPALQASYEALKKELDQKIAEFNIKYSQLQLKHDAAVKQIESLSAKHLELQGDYADLTAEHEALLNQSPQPEHLPDDDAPEVDPFAQMEPQVESAPAPKAAKAKK
jgi:hypothetical protein